MNRSHRRPGFVMSDNPTRQLLWVSRVHSIVWFSRASSSFWSLTSMLWYVAMICWDDNIVVWVCVWELSSNCAEIRDICLTFWVLPTWPLSRHLPESFAKWNCNVTVKKQKHYSNGNVPYNTAAPVLMMSILQGPVHLLGNLT